MKQFTALALLLLLAAAAAGTTLERGVSEAIGPENSPVFREAYRLKIENRAGGEISVSRDRGANWRRLGQVVYPTEKVSRTGYAAAQWIPPGRVAATAVNAIHLKVGSIEVERTIFSLLPGEFQRPPSSYRSFLSPDSSIYTDIPGGKAIFGGGESPLVGNPVLLSRAAEPLVDLPQGYRPKIGDVYYIIVDRPAVYPQEMVFENRFGGRITIKYLNGEEKLIGEVLRPVGGIGRFEGGLYAGPGRVRANHGGVIDISVAPLGKLGGFQIVPALHARGMSYVQYKPQWMVIGPARVDDPSLEGMAPFFSYFIQPNYRQDDLESPDWENKLLERFLVDVQLEGEEGWQPMPVRELERAFALPKWADTALDKVSKIRILFSVGERENG